MKICPLEVARPTSQKTSNFLLFFFFFFFDLMTSFVGKQARCTGDMQGFGQYQQNTPLVTYHYLCFVPVHQARVPKNKKKITLIKTAVTLCFVVVFFLSNFIYNNLFQNRKTDFESSLRSSDTQIFVVGFYGSVVRL